MQITPATGWHRRLRNAALAVFLLPMAADAAISVSHTRLIVTAQTREAAPSILNEGTRPVLIQTWIDSGGNAPDAADADAPFIADPPVFRLEPGQSRSVRVLRVGAVGDFARDRESLFFFNVLEIPPIADAGAGKQRNHLQISFQTRIKLFYRPEEVTAKNGADSDPLSFSMALGPAGQPFLRIANPTPLHQTLGMLTVVAADGTEYPLTAPMLAPAQRLELPLQTEVKSKQREDGWKARYSTIDDIGVEHAHEQVLPMAGH